MFRLFNLRRLKQLAAVSAIAILAACGSDDDETSADRTVVQQAQADPQFSILVEAVVAADLATTLSGDGPFTVFAPTNDAFASLLSELGITKEQLLDDKPLLTAVLTYHVVAGRVLEADVPVGVPITTLQGGTFTVDSALVITDQRSRTARILQTDVLVSNGVIHAIDRVLLPAPTAQPAAMAGPLPKFLH
jgi:uncharacterized surface protein with fasciclin (FAS1) repeats